MPNHDNFKIKLLLTSFFFFSFLSTSKALTLQQILTEVRVRIKDSAPILQRYTDQQLTNLINEGQRNVINATWALENSFSFSSVQGAAGYVLPSDLIAISRVTSNGKNIPETTFIQLDSLSGGSDWHSLQSVTLQNYFIDRTVSSSLGGWRIVLYPIPAVGTAVSTTTITVNYYAQPTLLALSSDVPFNGQPTLIIYHDTLIYYTAAVIYAIESETDKAKSYYDLYTSDVQLMTQNVGKRPNYLPGMSGPSGSR